MRKLVIEVSSASATGELFARYVIESAKLDQCLRVEARLQGNKVRVRPEKDGECVPCFDLRKENFDLETRH